jgi:hypothetical protein
MVGCPVGSIRREDSLEIKIESWCIGASAAPPSPFGNINMVELAELEDAAAAARRRHVASDGLRPVRRL